MKNKFFLRLNSSLFLFMLLLNACTSLAGSPGNGSAATPAVYTDPFAFCTATGRLDAPDQRYIGEAVPDAVMNGYLKAAGLDQSMASNPDFRKLTIWRCMGGKVLACNFGANLPCDSKANTDKAPTQAMSDFCKENKDSDFIPMVVTGHDTVYNWHCAGIVPEAQEQVSQVDAAGFIANIWYTLSDGK